MMVPENRERAYHNAQGRAVSCAERGTAIETRPNTFFISDQAALDAFVKRTASSSVLAIDTEFLREKTFFPKLCLLQMASDAEVVIVDPFAVDDLSVLAPLLENGSIMKLFHAGDQDLEILYKEVGVLPRPLFDTQVAAALLGHTLQIGYGSLVQTICGVSLKKVDSFTDWSRRPLSASQLEYAADDVIYLPHLYESMRERLEARGRLHWLDDDFAHLSDESTYRSDPRARFRRLKRVNQLSCKQMAAAREVAAWREERAQERDIPRKWVLTDEQIVEACKREARSIDELFMVRGVREHTTMHDARAVIKAIRRGLDSPPESWPAHDRPPRNEPNVDAEVDLMGALVRLRAKENDIAMQTLASHDDLAKVARGHIDDVDVMRGWRRAIVGEELLELLQGRISLHLRDGALVVERIPENSASTANAKEGWDER